MRRSRVPRFRHGLRALCSAAVAVPAERRIPDNPEGGLAAGDSETNSFRGFFGRDDGESGQAVVLFAIMMLALLFARGLAIDGRQLDASNRPQYQSADSAAFAGAVV